MSLSNVNLRSRTSADILPGDSGSRGKFSQSHDQIYPVIALLEIEHKKFPLGGIFNVHSK
jgi:hypothetical protein